MTVGHSGARIACCTILFVRLFCFCFVSLRIDSHRARRRRPGYPVITSMPPTTTPTATRTAATTTAAAPRVCIRSIVQSTVSPSHRATTAGAVGRDVRRLHGECDGLRRRRLAALVRMLCAQLQRRQVRLAEQRLVSRVSRVAAPQSALREQHGLVYNTLPRFVAVRLQLSN